MENQIYDKIQLRVRNHENNSIILKEFINCELMFAGNSLIILHKSEISDSGLTTTGDIFSLNEIITYKTHNFKTKTK